MAKVGPIVAKWVESQRDLAAEIGISESTMSQMLTGKIKFPMPRFVQVAYHLNPQQDEINHAFNIYLSRLDMPANSMILQTAKSVNQTVSSEKKIDNILQSIMASDLDPAVKVKIYNIITQNR
jgi:transcriptional regulator with XRE-family HTH domain